MFFKLMGAKQSDEPENKDEFTVSLNEVRAAMGKAPDNKNGDHRLVVKFSDKEPEEK